MKGYYDLTKNLHRYLIVNNFINNVTIGSLDEVVNAKKDMFPLAHVMINSAKFDGPAQSFNVTLLFMDIIDYTKEEITDAYLGNDNVVDILNQMHVVAQRFYTVASRGEMSTDYTMEIQPAVAELTPFVERFTDDVAGWEMTFDVTMAIEMTLC